ncbi:succinate dehydrogenase, hydrophobic membrane anchor protein [Gluconacetobacter sp. 1b LMG 1731]|uniref:Succinate dehydrogenase hydrophobic membrane anchor subunit n=2 Tax=Gluconacetobacter TaxID=89583 RepID=A0A7W4IJA4_9PROT|nr:MULTISPECIES: succinate dehydrogenase, hydrophobic membrane anchor protein [Gluconacetobacter]GBR03020.1 succinate dehydrogenase membrane anchor subunit [Gluconacetobacter liquefaciens NRIC 0522]MBB2163759.1 succinate dehydrogenase, hydrophobic membrane anchor protein [Gluconacetobacter dulcium]MBB2185113.1 succinate dehydrogenase, hydrophobic membrane anchor protein [Gluconacetobacter liquefaciens]MBB2193085.1 succinate dehydrogenase, hydrophobic membrane anchor protein [Gluconacetobacter d
MNASHTPRIDVMRSQLGRARGLGSAKTGVDHWWLERMSAVALVPLSGWFVIQVLRLAGAEQQDVVEWGGKPVNASMLLALMVLTFYHMQLGLQVIIDDYVHGKAHLPASLLLKGAALLIGLFAVIAVLKLALAPSTKAGA